MIMNKPWATLQWRSGWTFWWLPVARETEPKPESRLLRAWWFGDAVVPVACWEQTSLLLSSHARGRLRRRPERARGKSERESVWWKIRSKVQTLSADIQYAVKSFCPLETVEREREPWAGGLMFNQTDWPAWINKMFFNTRWPACAEYKVVCTIVTSVTSV